MPDVAEGFTTSADMISSSAAELVTEGVAIDVDEPLTHVTGATASKGEALGAW